MMKTFNNKGTTLVELLVALGIFIVFMAILYPSFTFLSGQMNVINDKQALSETGHRILNFIANDIRMTGFLTGSNPNVNHCGETVNALLHTDGNPYDAIEYLTSIPIETQQINVTNLALSNDANINDINITVNASSNSISTDYINLNGAGNAFALITFDTLSPTILQRVYQIASYNNTVITLTQGLAQRLNKGSRIYAVRRKKLFVDSTGGRRDLKITTWDANCTEDAIEETIYSSYGINFSQGGIDGLQFEYILNNNGNVSNVSSITDSDLPYVKAVTIWILIRFQFPSRDYQDTAIYTLGTVNPVQIGPFNDNFRREILSKTVEVKNLVF